MGGGSYSTVDSELRSTAYMTSTREEIFVQKTITNLMDPENTMRECCDSDEHPNTVPIIIALDVTGSMGYVPEQFIRDEMTKMMGGLYASGLTSSQVLFMGIGDHECDQAPLQVGQFEADDQLLDKWLKDIFLEGGGGGNEGESYLLAWYYGARHTTIDSFDKRGKKGFLFTIGDEPTLRKLPERNQRRIFGENGIYEDVTSNQLLKEASEKYNVYHLHLKETGSGARKSVQDRWKQDMQDQAIILASYSQVADTIIRVVKGTQGEQVEPDNGQTGQKEPVEAENEEVIL